MYDARAAVVMTQHLLCTLCASDSFFTVLAFPSDQMNAYNCCTDPLVHQ